jgi:hypothetical protein
VSGFSVPCRQRIKNRTFRHVITSTLRRQIAQDTFKALQVSDLAADVGNVQLGDILDLGAGETMPTDETEQSANLIKREA